MPASSVQALRDALTNPDAYPYRPDRIEIEQTHISLVALAPPWVYKVKKPVDLGFLDFTTLERRRHFCEEEVRLNARLCPDTYEGVVPIVATDDGLRVEGPPADGDVVEVAVKMRYLDPDQGLDARLEREASPQHDIDRVARRLCSFYAELSSSPDVAASGWIERLRAITDENFEQTTDQVGALLRQPVFNALRYYVDRFYDRHAALLHERRAGGHIVEGHGDLRLEHVHLTDERVAIFDCIEFNDEFRRLDVADDVAFLAMELDHYGHPALARRFVDRMVEGLNDPALRRLLPFYKCKRAYIRGKVEGMQALDSTMPTAEREESRALAQEHYQWALRYAVAGEEPLVVVVMGRPGTGKSTQAAALAEALGWSHVASDQVRKTQAGVPLHERPDAATRSKLYSTAHTEETYNTLLRRARDRGSAHQGTVLDATFSRRRHRNRLREALRAADLPYAFVELTASDETLRARLAARDGDGAAPVSDARLDDFDTLTERYEAPNALEDARHVRVHTDDRSEAATTEAILRTLIRLTG
ncbi:MAG: AAA family ATPase [Salinibacter sp.]